MSLPSLTVGPFFHFALTVDPKLGRIPGEGERIELRLRLFDGTGAAIPDGILEILQDEGFGRLPTNQDGLCVFETIRPRNGFISVTIFARGLLHHLHTRVYFGDVAEDPVLQLVPENRRHTLFARKDQTGAWTLDIHLQGEHETVFFEI